MPVNRFLLFCHWVLIYLDITKTPKSIHDDNVKSLEYQSKKITLQYYHNDTISSLLMYLTQCFSINHQDWTLYYLQLHKTWQPIREDFTAYGWTDTLLAVRYHWVSLYTMWPTYSQWVSKVWHWNVWQKNASSELQSQTNYSDLAFFYFWLLILKGRRFQTVA